MAVGIFLGFKMRDAFPGKSFFHRERSNPLQEVLTLIQKKYVDSVDLKSLTDSAVLTMLSKLDPHSIYIPAKDLQQINEEIKGQFFGIGIEFNIFSDTLHVTNVLKDGPSFKAGLQIGDMILAANDSAISGQKKSTDKIREYLRGPLGSEVSLKILRGKNFKKITVKRDIIPLSSIDAAYMIDSSVGFIRINKFSEQTYREFMQQLTSLKQQGMKKLILDLRDNGGGVLEEAVEIADEFLPGDKLITYTEGVHSEKKEYRCRRTGQFEEGGIVILADEGTASASEILIGALQDWDRATIIGRRTFGKGLVQEQFNLSDNSALRLTVARYYTPVGRSIQRSYTHGSKAYYDEITQRYSHGEMTIADSVKNDTSKIFKTVGGKKIYGGGGITPDIFVSADTTKMGYYTAIVFSKNLLNSFGYKYYVANPGLAGKYKSADEFVGSFNISETDWKFFENTLAKDSISLTGISAKEKLFLEKMLKSSIARQLYRTEGYFESINKDDSILVKALEVLKK